MYMPQTNTAAVSDSTVHMLVLACSRNSAGLRWLLSG